MELTVVLQASPMTAAIFYKYGQSDRNSSSDCSSELPTLLDIVYRHEMPSGLHLLAWCRLQGCVYSCLSSDLAFDVDGWAILQGPRLLHVQHAGALSGA